MSWEDAWPLVAWPSAGELERVITEVAELAELEAPLVTHCAWGLVKPSEGLGADADGVLPERTTITLVFRVPVEDALEVALRLDPTADAAQLEPELDPPKGELDWDAAERAGLVEHSSPAGVITRGLQPEHAERFTVRPAFYELAIDLFAPDDDEGDPARVTTYSNEYDNREGYPVLVHLAEAIAERLGLGDVDEAEAAEPSDDELN